MGTVVRDNLYCPACGSSDGGSIYKNEGKEGKDFLLFSCFSSKHDEGKFHMQVHSVETYEEDIVAKMNGERVPRSVEEKEEPHVMGLVGSGVFRELNDPKDPWGARGINEYTCKKYGVYVKELPFSRDPYKTAPILSQGKPVDFPSIVFPNYTDKGNLHAQKVRSHNPYTLDKDGKPSRTFDWYKSTDNAEVNKTFFGQNLWLGENQHRKKLVVTFGEFDAMSVFQMIGSDFCPISVPDGDTGLMKYVERYYTWMNKFSEIIFVPDADGQCIKYAQKAAAKFPRKAKLVHLTRFKDPSDYLQNNQLGAFREEFYAAQSFTPQKIVGLSSMVSLLKEDPPKPIAAYPFDGLNKMTGGIWPGELVTLKAPPKVGKSSFLNEIAYHLFRTTNARIGMLYLEETKRDLVCRLVGMHLNANLQRGVISNTDPRVHEAAMELTRPERFMVVDHWGACSSDFIEEKITELVLASGCQYILFDHISMAIMDESNKDERISLDRLIGALKSLTVGIPDFDDDGKEVVRQPTIFMVTHVNDDGKPRGSRAALQISNLVLGLERDKQAKTEEERNILTIRVEDNRRFGDTGVACLLSYDKDTGRLTEIQGTVDTPIQPVQHGGYIHVAK